MSKLRRITRTPPRSPEHQALAAAIARHHERLRELSDLRTAWRKASEKAQEAKRVVAQAESVEAEAEAANVRAMVEGKDTAILVRNSPSLDQARKRVRVADKALHVLIERIAEVESVVRYSAVDIDNARAGFLATCDGVQKLLSAKASLFAKLSDVNHALHAIWGVGGLPQIRSWHDMSDVPGGELAQHWRETITALHDDADARLPD